MSHRAACIPVSKFAVLDKAGLVQCHLNYAPKASKSPHAVGNRNGNLNGRTVCQILSMTLVKNSPRQNYASHF